MDEKKADRRVKYTEMVLKNTLIEKLQKEHISKISVTSICDMADVNRSTFYAHFDDPYDLLKSIEREALDNIKLYLGGLDYDASLPISYEVLHSILEYIKGNAALFNALLSDNVNKDIHEEILKLAEIVDFYAYSSVDERTKEYLTVFGITGCVSILQKWLEEGMPESTSDLAEFILLVLSKGVTGVISKTDTGAMSRSEKHSAKGRMI